MNPKQKLKANIKKFRKSLMMPPYQNLKNAPMEVLIKEEGMLRYFISLEDDSGLTIAKQLIEDGIELPDPDSLDGETQVYEKLWQVINGLAKRGYYLYNTDHLSDRQLYFELWNEILNDSAIDIVPGCGILGSEIDVAGEGHYFLQYYADEYHRKWHTEVCPDEPLPPQKSLPYNRDSQLPKVLEKNSGLKPAKCLQKNVE